MIHVRGPKDINYQIRQAYGLAHPRAPGLSLTDFRLVIADYGLGLPVLRTLELRTADHTSPERVMRQVYCSAFIGGCHDSDRLARLRQTVGQSHGLAGEHAIYDRVHAALLVPWPAFGLRARLPRR